MLLFVINTTQSKHGFIFLFIIGIWFWKKIPMFDLFNKYQLLLIWFWSKMRVDFKVQAKCSGRKID